MKEVSKEEVLNNFSYWSRAVLICSISKECSLSCIASQVKDSKSNPYFYNLIRFLNREGFIEVDKDRTPFSYRIKSNELAWFLREGKLFKLFEIIIKKSMGIKPYYYG